MSMLDVELQLHCIILHHHLLCWPSDDSKFSRKIEIANFKHATPAYLPMNVAWRLLLQRDTIKHEEDGQEPAGMWQPATDAGRM